MVDKYRALIEQKQQELKTLREQEFQTNAEEKKGVILIRLCDTFPMFYVTFKEELHNSQSVWFNCTPEDSKYGMPGILWRNHIFIGLNIDADPLRIYVGAWPNQSRYTTENGCFVCRPDIDIEEMTQERVDYEASFLKAVESCISLISSRGVASFPNWVEKE